MPCHVELTEQERNVPYEEIQLLTRLLCTACKRLADGDTPFKDRELMIWWIEHQERDQQRIKAEALAKLTPLEKYLLGL